MNIAATMAAYKPQSVIFTLFLLRSAPVLSVVINSTSEMCFSGSADSTIICWSIPSLDIDPYGPYSKFSSWSMCLDPLSSLHPYLLTLTCQCDRCLVPLAWELKAGLRHELRI